MVKPLVVDDSGLSTFHARPPLRTYIKSVWNYRYFILAEARFGAFASGRNMQLGKAWLVLDPILQVAVYALVFGVILQTNRGIDNFIGFLVIGVIFFKFMVGGLTGGSGLIQSSRNMITSFNFPKISMPIAKATRAFIDNLIPAAVAIVVAIAFQIRTLTPVSWTVLLVAPLYVLMHLFIGGLMMIVARVTAMLPDSRALVSVFSRGLFFISGVFYSIERFDSHHLIQSVMAANPIYQFLRGYRALILDGQTLSGGWWSVMSLVSIGTLAIGFLYFWEAEARFNRVK